MFNDNKGADAVTTTTGEHMIHIIEAWFFHEINWFQEFAAVT